MTRDLQSPEPLDAYLDALLARLRGTPRDVRRSLSECEEHLRERVAELRGEGRSEADATAEALAAFGDVHEVAAAFNRAHRPQALRALMPAAIFQACRLGAVGLVAIGISGLISWLVALASGTSAVFADLPGIRYDPSSCAHYLAVQRSATTCVQAALLEGRDDAILQRTAAGIVGVAVLLATMYWKRRRAAEAGTAIALGAPAALVGTTVFAAAGLCLTGYGVDRAIVNGGSGQWLVSGAVAIVVAAGYLWALYRRTVPT